MLDKPRDRTLWKKLLIALFSVTGTAFMFQFDGKTMLSYVVSWFGILLIVWAIIVGIHWFAVEEVSDAKP